MSNNRRNREPEDMAREHLYSSWHRPESMRRFTSAWEADSMRMIDVDAVEYCRFCNEPLALIETQRSEGPPKPANVMQNLAVAAHIPAFSLSYSVTPGQVWFGEDIASIRVQQLHNPDGPTDRTIKTMEPTQFVDFLADLRRNHPCGIHKRGAA